MIDTSCIFNLTGDPRRKSGLATLAASLLDLDIQGGKKVGHSQTAQLSSLSFTYLPLERSLSRAMTQLRMRTPR